MSRPPEQITRAAEGAKIGPYTTLIAEESLPADERPIAELVTYTTTACRSQGEYVDLYFFPKIADGQDPDEARIDYVVRMKATDLCRFADALRDPPSPA